MLKVRLAERVVDAYERWLAEGDRVSGPRVAAPSSHERLSGCSASSTGSSASPNRGAGSDGSAVVAERFEFAFAPSYRRLGAVFGIRPSTAWVEVDDSTFEARYGPWRVATPLENILGTEVTGPYTFAKAAGPARLALSDRGLSFTPNGERGLLIHFAKPVRGLDPFGLVRHPELTVGVAEPERLAETLGRASPVRP